MEAGFKTPIRVDQSQWGRKVSLVLKSLGFFRRGGVWVTSCWFGDDLRTPAVKSKMTPLGR